MVLERTYTIPLRREWQKVQRYKRAKKAVVAVQRFLRRHMKAEDVRIGKHLNEEIWKRSIGNPPAKVRVNAIKDDKGIVTVNLVGAPVKKEEKKVEKKKSVKEKIAEKVTGKKAETKEEKKDAKEEKPAVKEKPAAKEEKKPAANAEKKEALTKEQKETADKIRKESEEKIQAELKKLEEKK